MKLTIVMPCYNEETTIAQLINKLLIQPLPIDKEIIIVNDGSTDGSARILSSIKTPPGIRIVIVSHPQNLGKGQAVLTGVSYCRGDYLVIQDADLELDPADLPSLLKPILEGKATVVFGSRKKYGYNKMYFHSRFANTIVNRFARLLYGFELNDVSCGYKILPLDLFSQLQLKSKGFEFCTELTAKILNHKIKIF